MIGNSLDSFFKEMYGDQSGEFVHLAVFVLTESLTRVYRHITLPNFSFNIFLRFLIGLNSPATSLKPVSIVEI